ncbi:MAG: hypothetical protein HOW73_49520 [Polyangiaceae bacterium]|nr:hypothetical protein [Polyangiaceae bacterium]
MIVDPKWTFVEALNAAWASYPGGKQFGAPNRIKMLAQWANVVGRERAVGELNATLANYSTLSAAAKAFGFSDYALRTVRSDFGAMPSLTPHAPSPSTLRELFVSLRDIPDESEVGFMTRTIPRLAALLGYADSEVFFEMNLPGLGRGVRVDALLRPHGASRPKVIIEVKRGRVSESEARGVIEQLRDFSAAAGAEVGLLLSPHLVVVVQAQHQLEFSPERVTDSEVQSLKALLFNGAPVPPGTSPIAPREPAASRLQILLAAVASATTNDTKRASLEDLAAEAFSLHRSVRPKFRNLRTRSSEIDIVCELLAGTPFEFLREHGRYFLIECKNWAKPAGAKEIRDFLGKLRKCRVRVGVYFSRNGITGQEQGTDAIREIHAAFDTDGTFILVLAEQELAGISKLEQVMELLEDKMDALRFDL